jgi:hypothetical protein
VERNVDAHGVRAHLLHLGKPAQIGLLADGVVRRPLARAANVFSEITYPIAPENNTTKTTKMRNILINRVPIASICIFLQI